MICVMFSKGAARPDLEGGNDFRSQQAAPSVPSFLVFQTDVAGSLMRPATVSVLTRGSNTRPAAGPLQPTGPWPEPPRFQIAAPEAFDIRSGAAVDVLVTANPHALHNLLTLDDRRAYLHALADDLLAHDFLADDLLLDDRLLVVIHLPLNNYRLLVDLLIYDSLLNRCGVASHLGEITRLRRGAKKAQGTHGE